MASIIGHRNRGSERPAAHTQQKLNQVAPRAFLIQKHSLITMCMNFFIVCIPTIVYLLYVHLVSVDRRLLSWPSTGSDLHVPYRSESMTVVQ